MIMLMFWVEKSIIQICFDQSIDDINRTQVSEIVKSLIAVNIYSLL